MLEVKNLTLVRGGKKLFENLSFEVSSGQVFQIKGVNGSGKSSFLQAIAGDIEPSDGEILINGEKNIPPKRLVRLLGYLPQELSVDFPITVLDYLRMAGSPSQINHFLSKFQLDDLFTKRITELSLGQLQRVQFAQVMLQDPGIFLLDEPFSAQDRENTWLLMSVLEELKMKGKCVVLTNHIQMPMKDLIDNELVI